MIRIEALPSSQYISPPAAVRPAPLCPPTEHYMASIIRLYQEEETLIKKESDVCDRSTQTDLERLKKLDQRKIEQIKIYYHQNQSMTRWKTLQNLAQYVTSAVSIVLGLGLCTLAPVTGVFLIVSGGLGLIHRSISDSDGWKWFVSKFTANHEKIEKYAAVIERSFVYLSAILSMASAISAYHIGAYTLILQSSLPKILDKALAAISFAGSCFLWTTRFGVAVIDQRLQHLKADFKEMDTASLHHRQSLKIPTENIRRTIELSEKMQAAIQQAISTMR